MLENIQFITAKYTTPQQACGVRHSKYAHEQMLCICIWRLVGYGFKVGHKAMGLEKVHLSCLNSQDKYVYLSMGYKFAQKLSYEITYYYSWG